MASREESRSAGHVSAAIRDFLTPIVGEFVAKTSVNMASKRIGKLPDALTKVDLQPMAEALRPALRTIVGTAADSLVSQIKELSV